MHNRPTCPIVCPFFLRRRVTLQNVMESDVIRMGPDCNGTIISKLYHLDKGNGIFLSDDMNGGGPRSLYGLNTTFVLLFPKSFE